MAHIYQTLSSTNETAISIPSNDVKIPNGVSLKLDADEFNFNRTVYTLYINTDNAAGGIDVIINR